MTEVLPEDCLNTILDNLTDTDDYLRFTLISKLHHAVAEGFRSRLRKTGPRRRYIRTFNPDSDAMKKAQIIKEIVLAYGPRAGTHPLLNARIDDSYLIISDVFLYGSPISNAVLYTDLPQECKIPGISNLLDLASVLKNTVERLLGHPLSAPNLLMHPDWFPTFRIAASQSPDRKPAGEYSITFQSVVREGHDAELLGVVLHYPRDLKYYRTLPWESMLSTIQQIPALKKSEWIPSDSEIEMLDHAV